ncbi:hypothetical protein PS1_016095 [Malus domestica]
MASKGAVRFVGLDALSLDLASSLLRSGYKVQAFEMDGNLISEFLKLGGTRCGGPEEAGKDVAALVVLADQVNDATFRFQKDTVVILRSTILPSSIQNLKTRFTDTADLVDIYATKGVSDGLNGKIIIASSGGSETILKARPVLSAMCDKLYVFEGEVGAGSKIRMIKELLEGIHLVASLEAISLGTKAGIHPWIIYDIISNAAGNSWFVPTRSTYYLHFFNDSASCSIVKAKIQLRI